MNPDQLDLPDLSPEQLRRPWGALRRQLEAAYFRGLLTHYRGNVAACARHSGLDAANIRRIFARHGLAANAFRPVPVETGLKPATETAERKSTSTDEKSCNST